MKVQQITLTDMKSQEPQEKKFRQLSDEELEKVNGGGYPGKRIGVFIRCDDLTNPCDAGMHKNPNNNCQCEPMPNTFISVN